MTEKTDKMIAEAKLDRAKELDEEIDEFFGEIDERLERMKELHHEAMVLLGEEVEE